MASVVGAITTPLTGGLGHPGAPRSTMNLVKKIFNVKATRLEQDDVRELVEEVVDKVIKFA
ncbi:hypothetical protein KEJ27_03395 [Candidatus Bathyarchaeota archaeon]|nr:hypothetical protein [Candidatus Bathyarchaeota archaeon]MBS7617482.1 hypothetical protein [Candidatus Bathyarchaeota archaeon]